MEGDNLWDYRVVQQAPGRLGGGELAQLVTAFNAMASALAGQVDQLEQLEARASQFAADVSHGLRTPLTAMTAMADILHEQAAIRKRQRRRVWSARRYAT